MYNVCFNGGSIYFTETSTENQHGRYIKITAGAVKCNECLFISEGKSLCEINSSSVRFVQALSLRVQGQTEE